MNPPPPIPAPEGEVPPRIVIGIAVDGDFNPYLQIQSEGDLRDYFGDPMHGPTKNPVPYVPESALLAEKQRGLRAVEEAFEEAAENFRQCGETALYLTFKEKAQQSRAAKEPS